jgi:rare lipoprotein A
MAVLFAGCASSPRTASPGDGVHASTPANLAATPDAEPRLEPVRNGGPNKPYEVLGRDYVPLLHEGRFSERGIASWYGRKFHGRRTANGEVYDMFAMTAAHKTLPLPSYVRVRNPANGREVIVRVNDRGPFVAGRVIDLSYTAALKLDLLRGVAPVEIERITPDDIRTGAWRRDGGSPTLAQVPSAPARPAAAAPVVTVDSDAIALVAARLDRQGNTAQATATATAAPATAPASPPAIAPTGVSAAVAAMVPVVTLPALPSLPVPASAAASTAPPPALAQAAPTAMATPTPPASPPGDTATAAMSAPAEPLAIAPRGFWVQLGAFRERDGAESFQRHVQAELDWLAPRLGVFADAALFRLQAGPYPSRDEARGAAERVREALQLVPMVVERR